MDEDQISKGADVAIETNKTVRTSLEIVRAFGTVVWEIIGEPVKLATDIYVTDKLANRQFKNRLAMAKETARLLQIRGIEPEEFKELPFGDLVRIARASEEEDEVDMQLCWGRLLVNALDPNSETDARRVYTNLLAELSSTEILFLEILRLMDADDEARQPCLARWAELNSENRWVAVQNLMRLGCVAYCPTFVDTSKMFLPPNGQLKSAFPSFDNSALVDKQQMISALMQIQMNTNVASGLSSNLPSNGATRKKTPEHDRELALSMCEFFQTTTLGQSLLKACRE